MPQDDAALQNLEAVQLWRVKQTAICRSKLVYRGKVTAMIAAAQMRKEALITKNRRTRKISRNTNNTRRYPYECKVCRQWHLTHNRPEDWEDGIDGAATMSEKSGV